MNVCAGTDSMTEIYPETDHDDDDDDDEEDGASE